VVTDHPVQIAALSAGSQLPGFAYFMEQGLGKTLTALRDFQDKVDNHGATRLVVICPNSFKGGWADEIVKWGFDFDVHIYEAGSSLNNYWLKRPGEKPRVLIINYEATRMSGTAKNPIPSKGMDFVERFILGWVCMIVADESIQISTHDSLQTRGALALAKKFAFRRILSGKPMKQGPHDLWSQMRFIGHLDGYKYYPFRGAFCRMGGFNMKTVMGAQNEDILAERINPVVFRATKADWTDLPPKVYTIREYRLSAEVAAMYQSMEEDFVLWLNSDEVVTIDAAITKYIKLAQIQAGFIYDEDHETRILVPDERNPRLSALEEFVDTELTGKLIVVYNHKPVKKQLHYMLGQFGKVAHIHGGMETADIEAEKRKFNDDPDYKFICITKSAKYGHTLLGDQTNLDLACSTMAFYENTYSLDDRSQLEDRPHRHGQLQKTMNYVDFAGTPLDKDCVRALQRKEGIFQAVFSLIKSR
jgi:SNF2 family DNA or RNA helicase